MRYLTKTWFNGLSVRQKGLNRQQPIIVRFAFVCLTVELAKPHGFSQSFPVIISWTWIGYNLYLSDSRWTKKYNLSAN